MPPNMVKLDERSQTPRAELLVIVTLIAATAAKLYLAAVTLGTNDVVAFYQFAKALREHGVIWLYTHTVLFNHPALVAYYLRFILWFDLDVIHAGGACFPFLLRLPGIVADVGVVLALLWARSRTTASVPLSGLLLLSLSPVSLMVSGFHGNTDSVMTLLLVGAALMLLVERPILAGVLLALACQIKIIPLLFLPVLLLHFAARERVVPFLLAFAPTSLCASAEPLIRAPAAYFRDVLSYGGFWGAWGFTSLLRMTGLAQFSRISYVGLPSAQMFVAAALKAFVAGTALVIAYRRRGAAAHVAVQSIAWIFLVFFVFSPAVAPQYFVWCMPFLLLFLPVRWFGAAVAASSIFLFAFYQYTSGTFPWYYSHARPGLAPMLSAFALLPWATFALILCFTLLQRHRRPATICL